MEGGRWGHPGFNYPLPPPPPPPPRPRGFHLPFHRRGQVFGLRPAEYPVFPRLQPYAELDTEFDNSQDFHQTAFWGEPFESSQPTWRPRQKKKINTVLKQFPKQVYKSNAKAPDTDQNPQQSQSKTPNGDVKKREASDETKDADASTQPQKKLKANLPAKNIGVQGEASRRFSCDLCHYQTTDEKEIQRHFYSYLHREVIKQLTVYFPKQRVDFLHEYLLFKKKKTSMFMKKSNLQPFKDPLKGIGDNHYLHYVQATRCQACDVLIPCEPELVGAHIKSDTHDQNCKLLLKNTKANSLAAAKELLVNTEIVEMLTKYSKKQNPFENIAACSSQAGTTEVLVAEEDDDYIFDDDDADAGDDPEVPANHSESSAHEDEDSDNKILPPCEPGMMKRATASTTVIAGDLVNEEEKEEEEEEEEEEDEEAAEAP